MKVSNLSMGEQRRETPCKKCGGLLNNARNKCKTCVANNNVKSAKKHYIATDKRRAIEEHQENKYIDYDLD